MAPAATSLVSRSWSTSSSSSASSSSTPWADRWAYRAGGGVPHGQRHLGHALHDPPAERGHLPAGVGQGPLGDVSRQIGAALQLGENEQYADRVTETIHVGRVLGDLFPDRQFNLRRQVVNDPIAVDNALSNLAILVQQSTGGSGQRLADKRKQPSHRFVHVRDRHQDTIPTGPTPSPGVVGSTTSPSYLKPARRSEHAPLPESSDNTPGAVRGALNRPGIRGGSIL